MCPGKIHSAASVLQRQIETRDFLSLASDPAIERSIQACKTRTILTKQQALDIFKVRLFNDSSAAGGRVGARRLAEQYLVNEKTIRDIWSGRTWYRETLHLDPRRKLDPKRLKAPGRPRGYTSRREVQKPEESGDTLPRRNKPTNQQRHARYDEQSAALAGDVTGIVQQLKMSEPVANNFFRAALIGFGEPHRYEPDESESFEEVNPLPISSNPEDPFHDDWQHCLTEFFCQNALNEQESYEIKL
jgi:hypothetical protein